MAVTITVATVAGLVPQNLTDMEFVTHLWMKVYKKPQPVLPPTSK